MNILQRSQITLCLVPYSEILLCLLMFTALTHQGQGNNNTIDFYPLFILGALNLI